MCFAFDARPPELPGDLALRPLAGGSAAEFVDLTSSDGARFSAAIAVSPDDSPPAVVVLPDVRGLYRFYVDLIERFAQAGHSAIAIDYFGRTAGLGERDEHFDYPKHMEQTRVETIQADIAAAIEQLRQRTGASSVVTVGFCFGGANSFLAAANPGLALDGVVGFYGSLAARPNRPSPIERAVDVQCPVLGLFGGADDHIPPDQVSAFDSALADAGVDHELVTYPGAPHSFFDRSYEEHADASADAWRRVLGFLGRVGAA
jgi:carboxymethylenebutenolidase